MRLKCLIQLIVAASALAAITTVAGAQQPELDTAIDIVPERVEQFVYRWNAFDGRGWHAGFAPQGTDTLYFIADANNTVAAVKTLVYFWPITQRYVPAWESLAAPVEGTVEVLDSGEIIQRLTRETVVRHYPEDYWHEKILYYVYKGEKASHWREKFKEAEREYREELVAYYEAQRAYRQQMNAFFERAQKNRAGDTRAKDLQLPEEPTPPQPTNFFVSEPTQKFVIRLPAGRYRIRLRASDDTIVEGSEKELIVFAPRRTGAVGYEIRPGNQWTMLRTWDDPGEVAYTSGHNMLYVRAYLEDEYDRYYYEKLLDPQSDIRQGGTRWVHTKEMEQVQLIVRGVNTTEIIEEKPYKVLQTKSPELGYSIVEFSAADFPGQKPTFSGFQVLLRQGEIGREAHISLQRPDGRPIPSSTRSVRPVKPDPGSMLYYLTVFPLVIGAVVFGLRRRRTQR